MSISGIRPKIGDWVFIAAISVAALVYRRHDAFLEPQLWAEDGRVFLQDHLHLGASAICKPYAGYMVLVPRLIAFFSDVFGVSLFYIPHFYAFCALLLTICTSIFICNSAVKLGLKRPVIFSVAFLFLPLGSEIFMNITNILWILSLVPVIFLFTFSENPAQSTSFLSIVFLLLISLSCPVSVLLMPVCFLVLFKTWRSGNFKRKIQVGIIVISGFIQILVMVFGNSNVARTTPEPGEESHFGLFFIRLARELFFLNQEWLYDADQSMVNIVGLTLLAALFVFILGICFKHRFRIAWLFLLTAFLYLGSYIYMFWPHEAEIMPLRSPRYYFVPFACFAWIVLLWAEKLPVAFYAAYMVYWSFHAQYTRLSFPNMNWQLQIEKFVTGEIDEVPINPGWNIKLPRERPYMIIGPGHFTPSNHDQSQIINLWAGELLSQQLKLPPGDYEAEVIARGSPAGGVYPKISLYANDDRTGRFRLHSRFLNFPGLDFSVNETSTLILKLTIDNDAVVGKEDRNAFIQKINIYKR